MAGIYFTIALVVIYDVVVLFIQYSIYKRIEQNADQSVSATAQLLSYKKSTGLLMALPLALVAVMVFYSMGKSLYIGLIPLMGALLVWIYIFTVYRKRVNLLVSKIETNDQAVGKTFRFFYGFSNFREMGILFLVMLVGIGLMVLAIWFFYAKDF